MYTAAQQGKILTTEEKFVTIPYDVWNSKYKPMEENLIRTEQELEKEKESKVHSLYIDIKKVYQKDFHSYSYDSKRVVLGTFQIYLDRFSWVKEIKFQDIERVVNALVEEAVYFDGNEHLKMPSVEELGTMVEKMIKIQRSIDFKSEEIKEKIKKLPKIIKWLFGIKKVW